MQLGQLCGLLFRIDAIDKRAFLFERHRGPKIAGTDGIDELDPHFRSRVGPTSELSGGARLSFDEVVDLFEASPLDGRRGSPLHGTRADTACEA